MPGRGSGSFLCGAARAGGMALLVGAMCVVGSGCEAPPAVLNAFVTQLNAERSAAGVHPLTSNGWLELKADAAAAAMRDAWAAAGCPEDTSDYANPVPDFRAHYQPERALGRRDRGWGESSSSRNYDPADPGASATAMAHSLAQRQWDLLGSRDFTTIGVGIATGPTPAQQVGSCAAVPANSTAFIEIAFVK